MDDKQILSQITALVAEEHHLRSGGSGVSATRLRDLEESLDQCWDLLRRRRAARETGQNPDDVRPLAKADVEEYLQ